MQISNINQYNTIFSKESGVYRASIFSEDELVYFESTSSQNYPFSKRIEDNIEISIYDSSTQEMISWIAFTGSQFSTQLIESSYIDINGDLINNSYINTISDFYILKNGNKTNIVLDPISDIKMFGLNDESPYTVSYRPISDRVGSFRRPISIKEISPSRTEVKLGYGEKTNTETILEFSDFTNNKFKVNVVADDILSKVDNVRISNIYYSIKNKNLKAISLLGNLQGLNNDISIINFIESVHKESQPLSVFYQFKNWMYRLYPNINKLVKSVSQKDILDRYYEISNHLVEKYLSDKTPDTLSDSFKIVSGFIQNILDMIYVTSVVTTMSEYNRQRMEPLKTALNFGNNTLYYILNIQIINNDIVVKLLSPLESNIENGATCFISRLVSDPVFIDFSPYKFHTHELIELSPIDYSNFNFNNYQKTPNYDLSTEQGHRIENTILQLENKNLEVDYTTFNDFVKFSSVEYRLKIYNRKLKEIEKLESENLILSNSNDLYYKQEVSGNLQQISDLKRSFDGYETFLFNNSEWYAKHTSEYSGGTSASRYDKENLNSLYNNLPEYIINNTQNSEFLSFINVIGHQFDNLFVYINQFNKSKYPERFSQEQFFEGAINKMLSALGWDSSYSTNDIFLEFFGEDRYGNIIESKSGIERKKIIWKRFINALPYIIKTKGTEECIRILMSVYGVPKTLYKIKEFNSIPSTLTDRNNIFSFDNEYFALHFQGSAEYIQIEWPTDVQSLEFKVAFDTEKIHPDGSIFRLVSLGDNWVIGALRDGNDETFGRMFFTLTENPLDPDSIQTIVTDYIPLFDGNLYSVLLRKNDIIFDSSNTYIYEVNDSLVPRKFDLIVQRSERNRISISASSSFVFNPDFCNSFSGTNLETASVYVGNYNQVVTSSLVPDVDAFYGIIDEVKFYRNAITNDRFDSHTKYIDAYDISDALKLESDLLVYLDFEKPTNLYYGSTSESFSRGYVELENAALNDSIDDIRAYNFPKIVTTESFAVDTSACIEYPEAIYYFSGSFPWHFKSFRTREYISVPNFANSSLNTEKIYFVSQSLSDYLFTDISKTPSIDVGTSTPTVGVFFSPTDELNLEILQFFGKINLGNYIGNPADLYERTYSDFNMFRSKFFKHFNGINFNEYIKTIKHYIDQSMFKNISRTIPARSKLKQGILIEPSILERNKTKQYPPSLSYPFTQDSYINTKFLTNGKLHYSEHLSGNIEMNTNARNHHAFRKNYITAPEPCSSTFNGVIIKNGKRYFVQCFKETIKIFSETEEGKLTFYEKDVEKLNYTPISGSSISEILNNSNAKYGKNRYRTFLGLCPFKRYRRRIGSLSIQTDNTTIAESTDDYTVVNQIISTIPETPDPVPVNTPMVRFGNPTMLVGPTPRRRTRFDRQRTSTITGSAPSDINFVESETLSDANINQNIIDESINDSIVTEPGTIYVNSTDPHIVVTENEDGEKVYVSENIINRNYYDFRGLSLIGPLPYVVITGTTNNGSKPFGTTITDPTSIEIIDDGNWKKVDTERLR